MLPELCIVLSAQCDSITARAIRQCASSNPGTCQEQSVQPTLLLCLKAASLFCTQTCMKCLCRIAHLPPGRTGMH